MRKHATIDLETDPFKHGRLPAPFAAGFFDGKRHSVRWGPDCVKSILKACHKFDGLIYAHNGGKFDFHFLVEELIGRYGESNVKVLAIGSRIVSIKTPGPEFRDSFALIPKPLRSFGAKKEIEIDKLEADCRDRHKREIVDYLKQDCEGLHNALTEFFSRFGCQITLASTAFSVMKKDFGIVPPRTSFHHDKRFRPFYFAGRVQFWKLGECYPALGKSLKILDINSAFPWAMLFPHWFESGCIVRDTMPKKFREQSFYRIVADADGCFPLRGEDGSVGFPVAVDTEFHVTGWELIAAMDCGLVRNVRIQAVYQPNGCRDFGKFVRHFYEQKRTAKNEADRQFAKLVLNSSYGKFSINPRHFKDVRITPSGKMLPSPWKLSFEDESTGLAFWQRKTHEFGDRGEIKRDGEEDEKTRPAQFNNVCTSASITGCVRAFLMRSIHSCGGVIYCDTDSIIAQDTGSLELGDGLGQWKLEKECYRVWIAGKKLYAALGTDGSWKTASKGVRLTPEQIQAVALGEEQTFSFDAPSYSIFGGKRFSTRRVNRDDKRKRRKKA